MKQYLTRVNLIAVTLMTASLVILGTSVYLLANITVIQDWKLILPAQEIHVGDTVTVQSTYNKVRDASGESIRYITCKNLSGTWIRYELNRATSDRAKGRGGTGIVLVVRRDVADVPTSCKFEVAIRYDVMPGRHVNVYNSTRVFTLYPERATESSAPVSPAAIRSSQSPILSSSLSSSSAQSAPASAPAQRDTSQTTSRPTTENRISIPGLTPLLNALGINT
jgi:hypothetical protein